jgi:hypothetical protein
MPGDGSRPGWAQRPTVGPAPLGAGHAARARGERGQSTVELALVLPVVLALAFALIQVGLVVRDHVLVVHAAREGARAAAVSPSPDAARHAAEQGSGLDGDRLQVSTRGRGEPGSRVEVTVIYRSVTDLPLVGPLLGDVTLTASATMRVER